VDADTVLVLRGCGPKGYPGMPEVSNMPLPAKLLEQGVRDMVRVCDGRMSGTAYGTVVLHVAPEAAAGGPLGGSAPATGSCWTWSTAASTSSCRRTSWTPGHRPAMTDRLAQPRRGWEKLYVDTVRGAETGADLDFLIGASGRRRRPRLPLGVHCGPYHDKSWALGHQLITDHGPQVL
jgi:dihydroxy-acid dehydratase